MRKRSSRVGLGKGRGQGYKNIAPYDSHVHYLAGRGVTIYQPMFQKDKLAHLPLEIALYVPSTLRDKPVSKKEFDKRVEDAEKQMGKLFGGYTSTDQQGGWVDKEGTFIEEPVATVSAFTTVDKFEKNKKKFEDYVQSIQKKYKQDAISIEFEGDLFMTLPKKKYQIYVKPAGKSKYQPIDVYFDDKSEAQTFAGVETTAGMGEIYEVRKVN